MSNQITEITGAKADLNALLVSKGFHYISEIGGWDNISKKTKPGTYAIFRNNEGKEVKLVLIKYGEDPKELPCPKGAIFWLSRTAGTPDTYKIEGL